MSLRQLLTYAHQDDAVTALAEAAGSNGGEPERAFVSASLRPYLLAALLDRDPSRPALVVAGDDRGARDLAADLRAFLDPRPVRFYPTRGMRYESHLAPPPHLVGLRVAALDALLEPSMNGDGAVVVASAAALAEKVPDPELRPHGFAIELGAVLDLDEVADQLVGCGYERVEQVEDRGQFAVRGDILDVYPATEERAVRCELFDVEVERLTFFSTFTQRSLEEAERVEIAPAAELAPEHREAAEIGAWFARLADLVLAPFMADRRVDGAYDKLIEKLSPGLEDFPLRMLAPYRTISDEEAAEAARLLRQHFPDCG